MISAGTLSGKRRLIVGEAIVVLAWPSIECFVEAAFEHFHDAVCICVIVNWRSFAGCPYEDQLCEGVSMCQSGRMVWPRRGPARLHGNTYQIALAVAVVDQVPCVSSAVVGKCISIPVCLVGGIFLHKPLQLLYIYPSAVDAIARTEDGVDVLYKLMKAIYRFW